MEPYLTSAIVALAGAVVILWKRSDSSLSWLRKAYDDIVSRVRKLEDDRVNSEKLHGHEIKALAMDMLECRKADRAVQKELIDNIRKMPCKMDLMPTSVVGKNTAPIVKNKTRKVAKVSVALAAMMLCGCVNSNRQEATATTRTTERVGIEQGKPTQVTETVVERSTTDEKTQAGVDVSKAIAAGFAAIRGDIPGAVMAAVAQMKPAEPPAGGLDGTTAGLGIAAAGLGINALRDYLTKRALSKDRDEGWQKAQEAHQREVELARQLPPVTAQKKSG